MIPQMTVVAEMQSESLCRAKLRPLPKMRREHNNRQTNITTNGSLCVQGEKIAPAGPV